MTGPEHYREAERLLDPKGPLYVAVPEDIPVLIARAQVHATLALAAATALGAIRLDEDGMPSVDENAWLVVASLEDIGHGGAEDDD